MRRRARARGPCGAHAEERTWTSPGLLLLTLAAATAATGRALGLPFAFPLALLLLLFLLTAAAVDRRVQRGQQRFCRDQVELDRSGRPTTRWISAFACHRSPTFSLSVRRAPCAPARVKRRGRHRPPRRFVALSDRTACHAAAHTPAARGSGPYSRR